MILHLVSADGSRIQIGFCFSTAWCSRSRRKNVTLMEELLFYYHWYSRCRWSSREDRFTYQGGKGMPSTNDASLKRKFQGRKKKLPSVKSVQSFIWETGKLRSFLATVCSRGNSLRRSNFLPYFPACSIAHRCIRSWAGGNTNKQTHT